VYNTLLGVHNKGAGMPQWLAMMKKLGMSHTFRRAAELYCQQIYPGNADENTRGLTVCFLADFCPF
jgi:hypothetical protein